MARETGLAVTDEGIDGDIDADHQEPENNLHGLGKFGGVKDRQDIVFDEPAGVSRLPSLEPQRLFPGGQRADPTGELDERSPYRGRKMDPAKGWPPEDEDSPCYHENDEGKVNEDATISEQPVDHGRETRKAEHSRTAAMHDATGADSVGGSLVPSHRRAIRDPSDHPLGSPAGVSSRPADRPPWLGRLVVTSPYPLAWPLEPPKASRSSHRKYNHR